MAPIITRDGGNRSTPPVPVVHAPSDPRPKPRSLPPRSTPAKSTPSKSSQHANSFSTAPGVSATRAAAVYREFSECLLRCEVSRHLIDELGDDLLKRLLAFLLVSDWGELRLVKAEGRVKEIAVSEVIRKTR